MRGGGASITLFSCGPQNPKPCCGSHLLCQGSGGGLLPLFSHMRLPAPSLTSTTLPPCPFTHQYDPAPLSLHSPVRPCPPVVGKEWGGPALRRWLCTWPTAACQVSPHQGKELLTGTMPLTRLHPPLPLAGLLVYKGREDLGASGLCATAAQQPLLLRLLQGIPERGGAAHGELGPQLPAP